MHEPSSTWNEYNNMQRVPSNQAFHGNRQANVHPQTNQQRQPQSPSSTFHRPQTAPQALPGQWAPQPALSGAVPMQQRQTSFSSNYTPTSGTFPAYSPFSPPPPTSVDTLTMDEIWHSLNSMHPQSQGCLTELEFMRRFSALTQVIGLTTESHVCSSNVSKLYVSLWKQWAGRRAAVINELYLHLLDCLT